MNLNATNATISASESTISRSSFALAHFHQYTIILSREETYQYEVNSVNWPGERYQVIHYVFMRYFIHNSVT